MVNGESSSSVTNYCDIDEMVKLMSYKLNSYLSLDESYVSVNKSCKIPRVQELIRKVDHNAYEPIIVSIGPYHHGSSSLQALEKQKWNCLDYFLKVNRETKLEDYLNFVKDIEEEARACYSDNINMGQEKFLQMLLLDGCFILQYLNTVDGMLPSTSDTKIRNDGSSYFAVETINIECSASDCTYDISFMSNVIGKKKAPFCSSEDGDGRSSLAHTSPESPLLITEEVKSTQNNGEEIGNWYHSCIAHDLLLLENQVPFFILKGIYELVGGNRNPFSFLTDKIALFIEGFMQYYPKAIEKEHRPNDYNHILHLFHMYLRPNRKLVDGHRFLGRKIPFFSLANLKTGCRHADSNQNVSQDPWQDCSQRHHQLIQCRRAVQYHQAGVRFKKKLFDSNNPHSLLDISYENGVLEIPYLFIDQSTVSSFRNLIAFEQTCSLIGNDVTAYAAFLSFFISTPDDVALLAHKGVIVHQLRTDSEVSEIFTKLGKNVDFDLNGSHFLKHICHSLEEHYQSRVNRWMAWLWQNHFSNPWLILAVIAAAIVLFCTILQTLFSLLAYLKPANGK